MAVMNRFIFWFSMRLGAIIVGILSLVQAAIWLMISIITIKNQEDVRDFLNEIQTSLNLENKVFAYFANDPHVLLLVLTVFVAVYLVSCILLIVGSFMCKYKLLYPFLVVDMIYIIYMLVLIVMVLINLKKREFGFDMLILGSCLSALGLVILIYMWVCVFSLVQIINELHWEIAENRILLHDGSRQMKRMIDLPHKAQPNTYTTTD